MVVILLGPPGVGKGTQGEMLGEALGWERVSTGDLLRAARREGTALGKEAEKYMDAGNLVSDGLVGELVREHLSGIDPSRGIIFDGYPRTVPQAEALERVLPSVDRKVDAVLLLEATEEVVVQRISGRRSCPECQAVYNVFFDPPSSEGRCDRCGGALVHRSDDEEDTVRHRMTVYRELTEPLIAYYEGAAPPVLRIPGEKTMEEVRSAIREALRTGLGVEGGEEDGEEDGGGASGGA